MADLVAAIDQGTTSTRCILFDRAGTSVSSHQIEHDQIMPRAGWVEHDPLQIWQRTETVVQQSMAAGGVGAADIAAVGITNQRETTIVWNRRTGQPYHNAIVWQDTRTAQLVGDLDRAGTGDLIRERAGIPPATYFAGGKLAWLLAEVDGLRAAAEAGDALFGTIDTWLLWNLTGGTDGGRHLTDVTNASRTMLMNLAELRWDDELLELFDIPRAMLPEIVPSSHAEKFGTTRTAFGGEVVIGGVLGDQHAAMVGQVCLERGRRQEHVRDRQLPADEHRDRDRPLDPRAAQHGLLPVRRRARPVRPGGLDRGHRLGHPVAARPARHRLQRRRGGSAGPSRCPTPAGSTSCRPSRGCSRPTGGRTPAAPSSA